MSNNANPNFSGPLRVPRTPTKRLSPRNSPRRSPKMPFGRSFEAKENLLSVEDQFEMMDDFVLITPKKSPRISPRKSPRNSPRRSNAQTNLFKESLKLSTNKKKSIGIFGRIFGLFNRHKQGVFPIGF